MNPSIPDPDNQNIYGEMNHFFTNPYVLVVIVVLFITAVILSLGKLTSTGSGSSNSNSFINSSPGSSFLSQGDTGSSTSNTSSSSAIITIIAVAVMLVLIGLVAAQYLFGINVATSLTNVFDGQPQVNVAVEQDNTNINTGNENVITEMENDLENWNTKTKNKMRDQVFNIPGNYYNYEDAKVMCDAYGARLANYDEIEEAYNKGGEWCNYGWSEGQNAFFPTQKATFDNLQQIKGHEHDCGRPGINGGYIANPNVKFGVNCFGQKPNITEEERELMETSTPYPKTEEDIHMEKKVNYWKHHLNEILLSPFNYNNWST
jgi:Extracellular link domain